MSEDHRLLTVPDELSEPETYALTGNEHVSLPVISRRTGALLRANVLHMGCKGLVEFNGEPLARPYLAKGGTPVALVIESIDYRGHFMPRFHGKAQQLNVTTSYFAPPGYKGFVALLSVTNPEPTEHCVTAGITGSVDSVTEMIFSRRQVEGKHRFYYNKWSRAVVFEANTGLPVTALAVRPDAECAMELTPKIPWTRDGGGGPIPGLPAAYRLSREITVAPGATEHVAFYFGVGPEGDSAGLSTVDLARHGWRNLLAETEAWLQQRSRPAPTPALEGQLNRNLFFSLFFAAGKTIDTEETVLITSRSPRYYVSAAHWTRDSLLWAFPAALIADPSIAREHLLAAFRLYTRNPGIHALYIDGTVLYPGFELDELCAFIIALNRYLVATDDRSILSEPAIKAGLARVEAEMKRCQDPELGLGRTFLISSDDPAHHPFVTYSNALLSLSYGILARLQNRPEYAAESVRIRKAVYDHLVVEGTFGPQFCWSSDCKGDHILYDEPPGSLELLTHYRFTAADDPVYQNTVRWIYSTRNPHYEEGGRYNTPMCPHVHHPWILSVANGLLAGRDLLDLVASAAMDAGFACETIDRHSGKARTGAGFATCAGFLAYALDYAVNRR